MIDQDDYKPCPFCGSRDLEIEMSSRGKICYKYADNASLICKGCGVEFRHVIKERKKYVHIEGDTYRLIPERFAEDVLKDKWNSRV